MAGFEPAITGLQPAVLNHLTTFAFGMTKVIEIWMFRTIFNRHLFDYPVLRDSRRHWYPRRDSNSHVIRRKFLKLLCLPIPPLGHQNRAWPLLYDFYLQQQLGAPLKCNLTSLLASYQLSYSASTVSSTISSYPLTAINQVYSWKVLVYLQRQDSTPGSQALFYDCCGHYEVIQGLKRKKESFLTLYKYYIIIFIFLQISYYSSSVSQNSRRQSKQD